VNEERIIVISGYFDPIHKGHIEYIQLAKKLGDKLIVILNNDNQCAMKKGKAFMPIEDKKAILEAMEYVDEVFVSIDEDGSVCESLKAIKPHVFAQGGDRFSDEVPEGKVCRELGIEMVDNLGTKLQSSSDLIRAHKEFNSKHSLESAPEQKQEIRLDTKAQKEFEENDQNSV